MNTPWHRRETVEDVIRITDLEMIGSNEVDNHTVSVSAVLNPTTHATHTFHFELCTEDEVRVEVDVTLELDLESVNLLAVGSGTLFEGTARDIDDNEDNTSQSIAVIEDGLANINLELCDGG